MSEPSVRGIACVDAGGANGLVLVMRVADPCTQLLLGSSWTSYRCIVDVAKEPARVGASLSVRSVADGTRRAAEAAVARDGVVHPI